LRTPHCIIKHFATAGELWSCEANWSQPTTERALLNEIKNEFFNNAAPAPNKKSNSRFLDLSPLLQGIWQQL
jgi:hypothetical protein